MQCSAQKSQSEREREGVGGEVGERTLSILRGGPRIVGGFQREMSWWSVVDGIYVQTYRF